MPWAKQCRLGRTIRPVRFGGLRDAQRMERKREGFWRLRPYSTGLRGGSGEDRRDGPPDIAGLGDPIQQGPDGLINIPSPGAPPKLDDTQKAFLRRIVEEGPIPAIHGVVRWRACDLIMRLHDEFGLSVSDDTIYRALKDLGFSHVSARPKAYKQDADALAAFKKTLPYAWRKSARHSRLARQ